MKKKIEAEICLEGMEFHAFHGCLESERREGNLFVVDLRGTTDAERAAASDSLEDTINYAEVYELVRKEMEIPSNLLEHVAARIARSVKTSFPAFGSLTVRVSKKNPPVGGECSWSRVTITL